jgi:hypothetical protein
MLCLAAPLGDAIKNTAFFRLDRGPSPMERGLRVVANLGAAANVAHPT